MAGTRRLIRDGAGNVIGCTDGGDQWIIDNTPDRTSRRARRRRSAGRLLGKLNRGQNNGKANYNAIYLHRGKAVHRPGDWGFTTALTLQRATQQRRPGAQQRRDVQRSEPRHLRLEQRATAFRNGTAVTSANCRAPYGFMLSGTADPQLGSGVRQHHAVNGTMRLRTVPAASPTWAAALPEEGYRVQEARPSGRKDLQDALGPRAHRRFRGLQRLQLAQPHLFHLGRRVGRRTHRGRRMARLANDARQFQAGLKYKF